MNLSRNWLNEFVDLHDITDKQFNDEMTLSGSKVETIERLDESLKNVVAGKILSMEKHPDSDHMWVCQLDVGREEPVQIVTGAQNVTEGDLVPVAKHNSYLPGGVHITKGKLRGVESNGMLCSFKELGLTVNDCPTAYEDGIWILNNEDVEIGEDMNKVIGNDDLGIVNNITSIISKEEKISLRSISIDSHDGLFSGTLTVMLDDTSKLQLLEKKLKTIKGVKQVSRN